MRFWTSKISLTGLFVLFTSLPCITSDYIRILYPFELSALAFMLLTSTFGPAEPSSLEWAGHSQSYLIT